MALTKEEIKNIGRETGKKTVVKAKCKERAAFVMEQIKDAREQELETIMLSLPSISLKKAQGEIISDVNSHIETVKDFYPDMPIKELLLREYEQIKNQAINAGRNGQVIIVSRAAEGYGSIQDKLLNMLLEDFKQCECDDQEISQGVPLLDRPMPQTYADWVKLGDDIKAGYAEVHDQGGIATVDYNLNTISHEGSVPPIETNEAIANAKRWLLLTAGQLRVARKAKLPTRYDVKVTVWEERDRLHIGIVDKATEQISYADWWDDEARQMFEDGFFSHKHGLENSVLEYAEDMGILAK